MVLEMTSILLWGSTPYTTVASLEMSDEPQLFPYLGIFVAWLGNKFWEANATVLRRGSQPNPYSLQKWQLWQMTVYENVQAKLKKPMTKIHYIYIIYII